MSWVQGPAFGTAVATSIAKAFAGSTPVGNLVVVCVTQNFGGNPTRAIASVTDSAGNVYLPAIGKDGLSGPNNRLDFYYSVVTVSGTLTVTVAFSGGSAECDIAINEYDSTQTYLWDVSIATGTVSPAQPGSVSPPGTALYIVGFCHDAASTTTQPAGYNQRQEDETFTNATIQVSDLITTGAQNPGVTVAATIGNTLTAIITFADRPHASGGQGDDRFRFRPSALVSGTSTLGTKRNAWPDDACDGGWRDAMADNLARLN